VRGTRESGGDFGHGIEIATVDKTGARATGTIRGSVFEDNVEIGIFVRGSDALVEATVVRRTKEPSIDGAPAGIAIVDDVLHPGTRSTATVRKTLLEHNRGTGIYVFGSDLTVEATTLRDMDLQTVDAAAGAGILAVQTETTKEVANATVVSSAIQRCNTHGVLIDDAHAVIESTLIQDTQPGAGSLDGEGVFVQYDGGERPSVELRSSILDSNRTAGFVTIGADMLVEGTVVRGTTPQQSDRQLGRGAHIQPDVEFGFAPSVVTIRRSLFDANAGAGVFVVESEATIASSVIRGTTPEASGLIGDGILVISATGQPSHVTLDASRIETSARAGISCFGGSATIGSTVFECDPIQMDSETFIVPASFEDRGGNACGCHGTSTVCATQSASLSPPSDAHIDGTGMK
jgi:hypothetical protein